MGEQEKETLQRAAVTLLRLQEHPELASCAAL